MNKDEASSILLPDAWDEDGWPNTDPDKGHWPSRALSASGRRVREQIAKTRSALPVNPTSGP